MASSDDQPQNLGEEENLWNILLQLLLVYIMTDFLSDIHFPSDILSDYSNLFLGWEIEWNVEAGLWSRLVFIDSRWKRHLLWCN